MIETIRLFEATDAPASRTPLLPTSSTATTGPRRVGGHAHLFGINTGYIVPGRRLKLLPGVFSDSLRTRGVFLLNQHDANRPLANTQSGLLRLAATGVSLQFVANLPRTGPADHVYELVRLGVVTTMSIMFKYNRGTDTYDVRENGDTVTAIKRADLYEISFVTWACQPETTVGVLDSRASEESELDFLLEQRRAEIANPSYRRRVLHTVRELGEQRADMQRRLMASRLQLARAGR